jgi:hypothetical protein
LICDLSRDTRYALKNGHDRSRWYMVAIVRRPRLSGHADLTPPAYTAKSPLRSKRPRARRRCDVSHVLLQAGIKSHDVSTSCATATP